MKLSSPIFLDIPNAEICLYRNFLYDNQEEILYKELTDNIAWQQESIKFYGRKIPIPRLTAWYGDPNSSYTYSGILMNPLPWTKTLSLLKSQIEERIQHKFNSVLLNQYRNGSDSVAWHSDDEPELGESPVIASLSLGVSRKFELRSKVKSSPDKIELLLNSGDLLIMSGETQKNWQHQIPKMRRVKESRINLTFRNIIILGK